MSEFSDLIIPVIDLGSLRTAGTDGEFASAMENVGHQIDTACRSVGFFYIVNHGVPEELQNNMDALAHQFFALPFEEKNKIAMIHGGKAWRGFFAVGDEVTSGIPDQKEGIYFGTQMNNDEDPRPLHGSNLWPEGEIGEKMKVNVLSYLTHMKAIGQLLMKTIAHSLHLKEEQFGNQFVNPTELFRIFNYPPHDPVYGTKAMGVGEHTDYGYITILKQDVCGGLQVKDASTGQWIDAPFIPNSFVVNLGDALEHNTQGLYKATPHRVLQRLNATSNRVSMPYFFDPSFDSKMNSMLPFMSEADQRIVAERVALKTANPDLILTDRWDRMDPSMFQGTYGEYLMKKISRAFPALFEQQLGSSATSGEKVGVY
jgi:isopenicillin N synthase-like dioxygenase